MLLGGVGAAPGGPPLPLDPVMSAIAPESCLWYASSAGVGPANAASANETEKLFAETAVQRFFDGVHTQVMGAVQKNVGDNPEQKVLAAKIPILLKALMTRPVAGYVEEVHPRENGVKVEGAFVLNAGDQREAVDAALKSLLTIAAAKGLVTTPDSAAGLDWQLVGLPPEAPVVRFAWKNDYFLVAVGDATPARLVENMGGAAPAWLTQIRTEHPLAREFSIGYINIAGILDVAKPFIQKDDPKTWPAIETLGLTHIKALHAVSGYDAVGCARITHLVTDGEKAGLLGFVPHEPLTADDLSIAPKDATIALACRLNPSDVLEKFVALGTQFNPKVREDFDQDMKRAKAQLGFDIQTDVVGALGEAWVVYLPGGDLMSSWLNAAGAVGVKDAAKLRPAVAKLIEILKGQLAQSGGGTINESKAGEQTTYTLQIAGAPVPISPSLCVSDKWLVIGASAQAVQAALNRSVENSLATADPVKQALAAKSPPSALAYQDTPQLVRSLYPWVQMGAQMLAAQLAQQGVTIDLSILPPSETIVKHLRPSVSTLTSGKDGFHVATVGSLPGGGNIPATAPVLAAFVLPAIGNARQAAQNAQEMNTLRQLALAALNFESATGALPSDIYSDDGKPLLSWRVRVLPYMEYQALYNQFHLDEPWDSEHNKPLLDQMPAVLKSPSTGDLGNRTQFLALKGDATLFPGNERLQFRDITDGTSNTVLFVHANPESAVEWTKPEDVEFDASKPFAAVANPSGKFLIAFCDGSVRALSLGIGAEAMKALATRAGGEAIPNDALMAAPAPGLYSPDAAGGVVEEAAVAH
jgi:hypothetical protein